MRPIIDPLWRAFYAARLGEAKKDTPQALLHQLVQSDAGVVATTAVVVEHIMLKPIRQPKTPLVVRLDPQQELARAVLAQAVVDASSMRIRFRRAEGVTERPASPARSGGSPAQHLQPNACTPIRDEP